MVNSLQAAEHVRNTEQNVGTNTRRYVHKYPKESVSEPNSKDPYESH